MCNNKRDLAMRYLREAPCGATQEWTERWCMAHACTEGELADALVWDEADAEAQAARFDEQEYGRLVMMEDSDYAS